jgi:hypothetical protein
MSRTKSMLLVLTALSAVRLCSATVTYGVGACGLTGVTSFPTIAAALAATPAPNVVKVCPGTYPEQVIITIPVTLQGALANGKGQAFITVPSGGLKTNASDSGGDPVAAEIYVDNATGPVNISNIGVDGSGNGVSSDSQPFIAGIFYENSSGTVNEVETRYQQGDGDGVGIWADGGSAHATVTVQNSNVHNFDGFGIFMSSELSVLTATVEGNTVIAGNNDRGASGLTVQDGVSITASGNFFNGQGDSDTIGISIFGGPTGTISNNTITYTAQGILIDGNAVSLSLTSNKLYDIIGTAIQLFGPATVESNIITQAQNGIDFTCEVDNNVSSNTLSAIHSDGLLNVPTSVTSTNTYYNVPTIRSGGC